MSLNLLSEFFCHSRNWARATRELELFQKAASDLQRFGDMDSGFFVYFKSFQRDALQRISVYVPWGVFSEEEGQIQSLLVDPVITSPEVLSLMQERWIRAEDISPQLQIVMAMYRILQMGIWPLVSQEKIIGAIVVAKTGSVSNLLSVEMRVTLLDTCASQVSLALELIGAYRLAEQASELDPLTGLLNHRGLKARLPRLIEQSKHASKHVVFGLTDLDRLKFINDTQGHPAGDNALNQIASIIRCNIRADDIVARFGGDEFAVVLQVDRQEGTSVMNRLREAIYEQSNGYSVSVGGAVWGIDGDTFEQCYQIADSRLYVSKHLAKGMMSSEFHNADECLKAKGTLKKNVPLG